MSARPSLGGLSGIVVAATRDCRTRLDFAQVFLRPGPNRVRFDGIVLVDVHNDAEMTQARSLLPGLRFFPGTSAHRRILNATREVTPVLILFDGHGVLRMALPAPRTAQATERLVKWLATRAMS